MAKKGKLFDLSEARNMGLDILKVLESHTERAVIAGSIRRGRPKVHDIDIVVIAAPLMFPSYIASSLSMKFGLSKTKVERGGPKILAMKIRGFPVQFYNSNKKSWGVHLLRWTGSVEHNIMLCMRARELGMRLRVSEGLFKDGKLIASKTEDDVFRGLHMPYIEPEKREVENGVLGK